MARSIDELIEEAIERADEERFLDWDEVDEDEYWDDDPMSVDEFYRMKLSRADMGW